MTPSQPLLTIAIPTYNRSAELKILLDQLAPQLTAHPEVDLLISDNASPDDTPAVVQRFLDAGLRARYLRHPENIGADRNFLSCFDNARGTYFWLCGDDDIIVPGALDRILPHLRDPLDLLYIAGYGFREDFLAERREDPLRRKFQNFTDPHQFAQVVNIMFTFISGILINRDRLLAIPHESPEALLSTNLVQLSWSLPLLLHHRRSVVVWQRSLAGRWGNAGGYALGRVFGRNLHAALERLLPGRSDLQHVILNFTLRRWLPSIFYSMRADNNQHLGLDTAGEEFRQAYGDNPRYWLFAYPVLKLPLPLAKLWLRLGKLVNMAIYILTVPRFWRREN